MHEKAGRGFQARTAGGAVPRAGETIAAPRRATPATVPNAPATTTSSPFRARARTGPSAPETQVLTAPVVLSTAARFGPEAVRSLLPVGGPRRCTRSNSPPT